MAWTYGAMPSTDPTDEVHFLVGDTDPDDPLIQDEEIEMLLSLYPKPAGKPAYLAAAAGCDAIASKFGRKMQRSVGPISLSAQQQYEHYVELAQQLRVAYATDGKGIIPSTSMRIHPGVPMLGGGGNTVLGGNTVSSGGTGTPL